MSLKGKNVFVFGGSAGIGAATVKLLADDGANVTAVGRDQAKLDKLSTEMPNVKTISCDMMNNDDVVAVFANTDAVHHVVMTAATIKRGRIVETDYDTLKHAFHERIGSIFRIVKAAVPKMKGGSFTFCSGTGAIKPVAGAGTGAAAVAAVEHITRTLSLELGPIRVNAIRPGLIMTELVKSAGGANWEKMVAGIVSNLPGKKAGTPDQAADAIRFLMLNEYMTGEVLTIDGGGRWT